MSEQVRTNQANGTADAERSALALDWAELETVSGRLEGLMARQALAVGDQQLRLEIYAVRQEREEIVSRIFGFVPELVGNA